MDTPRAMISSFVLYTLGAAALSGLCASASACPEEASRPCLVVKSEHGMALSRHRRTRGVCASIQSRGRGEGNQGGSTERGRRGMGCISLCLSRSLPRPTSPAPRPRPAPRSRDAWLPAARFPRVRTGGDGHLPAGRGAHRIDVDWSCPQSSSSTIASLLSPLHRHHSCGAPHRSSSSRALLALALHAYTPSRTRTRPPSAYIPSKNSRSATCSYRETQ